MKFTGKDVFFLQRLHRSAATLDGSRNSLASRKSKLATRASQLSEARP
jgi:hypothetical protein